MKPAPVFSVVTKTKASTWVFVSCLFYLVGVMRKVVL